MIKIKSIISAVALSFIFFQPYCANATLWDIGGGLIYDDALDITWLQDANNAFTSSYDPDGIMSWTDAKTWAENLEYYDSERDVIWKDWRLPDAHNQDGTGPDQGFNITDSELGHMYYINLLGTAHGPAPNLSFIDGNGYSVSFLNLQNGWYWTRNYHPFPAYAWANHMGEGNQVFSWPDNTFHAWAVHEGNLGATIPEPATMLLLGTGLAGLIRFRKKFRSRSIYLSKSKSSN